MRRLNLDDVLDDPAETFDAVIRDPAEVVVGRPVPRAVVVGLDEHRSLQESIHLMRVPENAAWILRPIERLEDGLGTWPG